jgi:hypothetical protein
MEKELIPRLDILHFKHIKAEFKDIFGATLSRNLLSENEAENEADNFIKEHPNSQTILCELIPYLLNNKFILLYNKIPCFTVLADT